MTNLDYALQYFKKAYYDNDDYFLNDRYSIHWLGDESFVVDITYYDHDVGYVTDNDIFKGSFKECLDYVKKQEGIE